MNLALGVSIIDNEPRYEVGVSIIDNESRKLKIDLNMNKECFAMSWNEWMF